VWGNNSSSIKCANGPGVCQNIRHADICHHKTREEVEANNVQLSKVPTHNNLADIMTKHRSGSAP
jgi:DUF4097 and DUF4098 domain-containing protein YvlB